MLYNVMIYDVSHGGDNSTILMADSGRLAFTGDMRYLYLHLFNGEQFENLREQRSLDRNVPFRREEFADKEVLIPFDANFNRLDEGVCEINTWVRMCRSCATLSTLWACDLTQPGRYMPRICDTPPSLCCGIGIQAGLHSI